MLFFFSDNDIFYAMQINDNISMLFSGMGFQKELKKKRLGLLLPSSCLFLCYFNGSFLGVYFDPVAGLDDFAWVPVQPVHQGYAYDS